MSVGGWVGPAHVVVSPRIHLNDGMHLLMTMVPITFRLTSTDSSTHNCLLTTTILAPGLYRLRVANDSDLVARHVHGHPFAVVHTRLRVLLLDQDPAFLILVCAHNYVDGLIDVSSYSSAPSSASFRFRTRPRLEGEHWDSLELKVPLVWQANMNLKNRFRSATSNKHSTATMILLTFNSVRAKKVDSALFWRANMVQIMSVSITNDALPQAGESGS